MSSVCVLLLFIICYLFLHIDGLNVWNSSFSDTPCIHKCMLCFNDDWYRILPCLVFNSQLSSFMFFLLKLYWEFIIVRCSQCNGNFSFLKLYWEFILFRCSQCDGIFIFLSAIMKYFLLLKNVLTFPLLF